MREKLFRKKNKMLKKHKKEMLRNKKIVLLIMFRGILEIVIVAMVKRMIRKKKSDETDLS